eukprot:5187981-Prymnesium_polylepis.1
MMQTFVLTPTQSNTRTRRQHGADSTARRANGGYLRRLPKTPRRLPATHPIPSQHAACGLISPHSPSTRRTPSHSSAVPRHARAATESKHGTATRVPACAAAARPTTRPRSVSLRALRVSSRRPQRARLFSAWRPGARFWRRRSSRRLLTHPPPDVHAQQVAVVVDGADDNVVAGDAKGKRARERKRRRRRGGDGARERGGVAAHLDGKQREDDAEAVHPPRAAQPRGRAESLHDEQRL